MSVADSAVSVNSTGSAVLFHDAQDAMNAVGSQPDLSIDFSGNSPNKSRGRQRKRIPSRLFRVETGDIPQLTQYRRSMAHNLATIYEQNTLKEVRGKKRKEKVREIMVKTPKTAEKPVSPGPPTDEFVLKLSDIVAQGTPRKPGGEAGNAGSASSCALAGRLTEVGPEQKVSDEVSDAHPYEIHSKEIFDFCTVSRDFGYALMSSTDPSLPVWKRYRFEFKNGSITLFRKGRLISKREKKAGSICLRGGALVSIPGKMEQRPNCFVVLDVVSGHANLFSVEKEATKQQWEQAIDDHIQFCSLFPEHVRKVGSGESTEDSVETGCCV